ncbi:acetylcholinesterase [Tetranychus urticae]|uniref:Carboxylic ester hydrolase n=1 Tax=Tetranychus urticae TaxID=32264 RepID=T1KTH5_TETUR|nr:acetylcholinesterase [Tetranychus urticae]
MFVAFLLKMKPINSLLFTILVFTFNFTFLQGNASSEDPTLTISTGQIKGKSVSFRGSQVYQFLGIPFAEPPLNELRFTKPVPKKPWDNVIPVNKWGPHCIQPEFPGFNEGYPSDEDCLVLNVFVTQSTLDGVKSGIKKPRPVMVWIHGGGFSFGSANVDFYDGTPLTVMNDIVFVSINYRLGAFGFLHLPESGIPGNFGLWDQLLALKWVKDNIHFFGGNPDQVTIFGESAGSMSVSALIVSPHSRGLFKNAIMQSGSIYDMHLWSNSKTSEVLLEKLNCSSVDDIVSCLRSVKATDFNILAGFLYWPIIGDEFLPSQPQELMKSIDKNVNILLGVVGNEGAGMLTTLDNKIFHPVDPVDLSVDQARKFLKQVFGEKHEEYFTKIYLDHVDPENSNELRLALAQAIGDVSLGCPTYIFGIDAVKIGQANVYAYVQTQKPSKSFFAFISNTTWIPATHGEDVPMMFGAPFLDPLGYTQEDILLSTVMLNTWGNFAKFGEPRFFGESDIWSKWKSDESGKFEKFVMEFNTQRFGLTNNQAVENCEKNWPFPIDSVNLNFSLDELENLSRDEL